MSHTLTRGNMKCFNLHLIHKQKNCHICLSFSHTQTCFACISGLLINLVAMPHCVLRDGLIYILFYFNTPITHSSMWLVGASNSRNFLKMLTKTKFIICSYHPHTMYVWATFCVWPCKIVFAQVSLLTHSEYNISMDPADCRTSQELALDEILRS